MLGWLIKHPSPVGTTEINFIALLINAELHTQYAAVQRNTFKKMDDLSVVPTGLEFYISLPSTKVLGYFRSAPTGRRNISEQFLDLVWSCIQKLEHQNRETVLCPFMPYFVSLAPAPPALGEAIRQIRRISAPEASLLPFFLAGH